jgi:hypothetical protein
MRTLLCEARTFVSLQKLHRVVKMSLDDLEVLLLLLRIVLRLASSQELSEATSYRQTVSEIVMKPIFSWCHWTAFLRQKREEKKGIRFPLLLDAAKTTRFSI